TGTAVRLERERSDATVNLPAWVTPLVGRNQFIEQVRPTLLQRRLVVLKGEGGIGKSRLAAQLALELSSELHLDAHWLSLRTATSARQLPRLLANTLDLEPHDELDPVLKQLHNHKLLLVLDEADALIGSAGILEKLAGAAPGIRLIVTVRYPLHLEGETVLKVPLLEAPAARELFSRAAARHGARLTADEPVITELLSHVGYAPLNIELAAAWSRVFSPEDLLGQLTATPELLTAAPGLRPETARFIDITRKLMSPTEQELLGTLALIPGSFTAELAQKAAGASAFFLLALLEHALLHREQDRYTVHAAIAERFRAGLQNPEVARRRITSAWCELAEEIEDLGYYGRSTHGFRLVDEEEANFRFAIREVLNEPNTEQLWPLVQMMRGYLDVRGRRRDGLELFQAIDGAITHLGDAELRGCVRESVALFLQQDGRLPEAERAINEAIELLEDAAPDSESLGLAWNTAGIIHAVSGDDDAALEAFNRSASIRARLGDENLELQARLNAVIILSDIKEPEDALKELDAVLDRCRIAGQVTGGCLMLIRKAKLLREAGLGSIEERFSCLREALDNAESSGYPQAGRTACGELAETYLELGQPLDAAAAFEEAARWAEAENREDARRELLARADELRQRASQRGRLYGGASAGQQL
ncbi:MAG TPA: AAA family ATPase, partial [Deinococcales bacterium]|nr:AAA family ATPase [Deinococcales bacterium]